MHEQRLTTRLINYWEKIRSSDSRPAFFRLNPGAIDDIWQNCLALQTQPGKSDNPHYLYVHCGDAVAEAIGKDVRGEIMSAKMKFFPGVKIVKRVDDVVNGTAESPVIDDGQFVNDKGKVIKYRACLLAFGDNQAVTHVVIGVSWRAF